MSWLKQLFKGKKKIPVVGGILSTNKLSDSSSQDTIADPNFQKDNSTWHHPEQPPLLPTEEPNYPLYVAKYGYSSRTDDDLGFEKGDLLYIINRDDEGWWFARAKLTGQEGYIPNNYVAEHKSLDAEE